MIKNVITEMKLEFSKCFPLADKQLGRTCGMHKSMNLPLSKKQRVNPLLFY